MTAILVNDDAAYWFESGMVKDVTICDNSFKECGEPVIDIHPENTEQGNAAVHSGIKVIGNTFTSPRSLVFAAKSTSCIKITKNTVHRKGSSKNISDLIRLTDCTQVDFSGNVVQP